MDWETWFSHPVFLPGKREHLLMIQQQQKVCLGPVRLMPSLRYCCARREFSSLFCPVGLSVSDEVKKQRCLKKLESKATEEAQRRVSEMASGPDGGVQARAGGRELALAPLLWIPTQRNRTNKTDRAGMTCADMGFFNLNFVLLTETTAGWGMECCTRP